MIEIFILLSAVATERISEIIFNDLHGRRQAIDFPEGSKTKGRQVSARSPSLRSRPGDGDELLASLLGMTSATARSSSGRTTPVKSVSVKKDGKDVFSWQAPGRRKASGSGTGGKVQEKNQDVLDFMM